MKLIIALIAILFGWVGVRFLTVLFVILVIWFGFATLVSLVFEVVFALLGLNGYGESKQPPDEDSPNKRPPWMPPDEKM